MKNNKTSLHLAAENGNVKTIKKLLAAGADINARDIHGSTPVIVAALDGQVEAIRILLKAGADVHAMNMQRETPLHYASGAGDVEAIRVLLEAGADKYAKNEDGLAPVDIAIAESKFEAISAQPTTGQDTTLQFTTSDGRIIPVHIFCAMDEDHPSNDWRDDLRQDDESFELQGQIDRIVAEYGWGVNVGRTEPSQVSYALTTGLTETFDHPELLVIGFDPGAMIDIVNVAAKLLRSGIRFSDSARINRVVSEGVVAFRSVEPDNSLPHSELLDHRYGKNGYEILQMFLPDDAGLFPWEPGCDSEMAKFQTQIRLRKKTV